jgi:hypothetical protein
MGTISRLVEEASEMNPRLFSQTVDQTERVLSAEKDGFGKLQVVGRLVRMPPSGEATVIGDLHGDIDSLKQILTEAEFKKMVK